MLPSKGYFKALECPYYVESFCDRPYCHFKHTKHEFLSDLDCQNQLESENKSVTTSHNPKLHEEPKLKQKVKSKIIEYVPQCIKSKNSELVKNSCNYGSTTEIGKKETPIFQYIPSPLNDTNVNIELDKFESNSGFNEKQQTEPIKCTEEIPNNINVSKQNSNIAEYVPTVIKKSTDLKTNKDKDEHLDKHHSDQGSLSKRKHESSRQSIKSSASSSKSSRSSSQSSSQSKKPKKDKSPEPLKIKKEEVKEEKKHSKDQDNKHIKHNTTTIPCVQKSLKEAVMEKVKDKLVKPNIIKADLDCSSDEDNLPKTELIESELMDFFNSDDSDSEQNEQKTCVNVVEAKIKKRISHISPSSIFSKINANKDIRPRCSKSLHELVATRVQATQNNVISNNIVGLSKRPISNLNNDPTLPMLKSKNRIAHQPKIELVTTECQTPQSSKVENKEITTNVKLNLKIKLFKSSNNMPNPLRQSCLEKLYTAFINHYSSEEAIDKALTTEEEVHNKAKSTGIYRNLIVQSLMKANKTPELQVKLNPNYPSHMYGVCLYELLHKYILSREDLEKNGYPLIGDNNLAYISKNAYYYQPLSTKRNGDKFVCMNCKSEFEVDKRGMPTITLSKCIYHSGKLKFDRSKNEKFWLCCYRRQHESGCETSIYHMPDKLDDDAMKNFVVTKGIPNKNIKGPNFYALDCEMVNTTIGIEIVRVTVINHEGEEVYESKVKPNNLILDYKSKYSGITEESLKNCTKRLLDVQIDLLKIFDMDTILIGHSLDSDLKALKIVHYNVVDTSIIYPHKYGPPFKWGLKLLSEQHLQRIIQSEEGHDSKEDALASLDLVWKKLKEDVKKFKPINIISIDKR